MTPPPPRRWTWTRIVLVVSLGLNLAVIGLVGAAVWGGPPGSRVSGESGLWEYGTALPPDHRRALVHALRETRGDWGARRAALRDQRAALAAALTAEPYDPAAVAAQLEAGRDLVTGLADRGTQLLLQEIARMDAAARREYADRLMRGPDREGRRNGGPHD